MHTKHSLITQTLFSSLELKAKERSRLTKDMGLIKKSCEPNKESLCNKLTGLAKGHTLKISKYMSLYKFIFQQYLLVSLNVSFVITSSSSELIL